MVNTLSFAAKAAAAMELTDLVRKIRDSDRWRVIQGNGNIYIASAGWIFCEALNAESWCHDSKEHVAYLTGIQRHLKLANVLWQIGSTLLHRHRQAILPEFVERWRRTPADVENDSQRLFDCRSGLSPMTQQALQDWWDTAYGNPSDLQPLDPMPDDSELMGTDVDGNYEAVQSMSRKTVGEISISLAAISQNSAVPEKLRGKSGSRTKGTPADEANILARDWLYANGKTDHSGITRDMVAQETGLSTGSVSSSPRRVERPPRRDPRGGVSRDRAIESITYRNRSSRRRPDC